MTTFYSRNDYTGDGSTTDFAFSFPYFFNTDVKLYRNYGLDITTTMTWLSTGIVRLSPAPLVGDIVMLRRQTQAGTIKATIQNGSVRPADINTDDTQLLFLAQEMLDQPINASAADAAAASGTAQAAAASATISKNAAASSATSAATQATNASTSATAAAVSAALSAVNGKVFQNTTDGLAGTSSSGATNRYFAVPQAPGSNYMNLYLNAAGVATLVNTYPDVTAIVALQELGGQAMEFNDLWTPSPGLYPAAQFIKTLFLNASNRLVKFPVTNADYADYGMIRFTNMGYQNLVGQTSGGATNVVLPYAWIITGVWAKIGGLWIEMYDGLKDGISLWEAVWGFGKTTSLLNTFSPVSFLHGGLQYRTNNDISWAMDGGSNQNLAALMTKLQGESLVLDQKYNTILPEDGTTVMGTMQSVHTFTADWLTQTSIYATSFANQGTFTSYSGQTVTTAMNQAKAAGGPIITIGKRTVVMAQFAGTVMTVVGDPLMGNTLRASGQAVNFSGVVPGTETIPGGTGTGGAGTYFLNHTTGTVARRPVMISEGAATSQVDIGVNQPTLVGFNHTARPTAIFEHFLPKGWPADPLQWSEVKNPTRPFLTLNPADDKYDVQAVSEISAAIAQPATVNTGNQWRWRVGALA